jgi:DNA-binding HxlR family transcriptional regulator
MYERKIKEDLDCGIIVATKIFGGKWKSCIIDAISRGTKRPSELHREITSTSPRVIDMQLSELIAYGVLSKTIHPGFPLCVEYALTSLGESILPILAQLNAWGIRNKEVAMKVGNDEVSIEKKKSGFSSIC